MWFIFATLSALIYSIRSILEKWALRSVNPYVLALAVRLFALPLFFLPFIFGVSKFPSFTEIPIQFWGSIIVVSFISTPLEMIFFYKALRTEEVSYVAPLLGLSPLITTILGALFFEEAPTFAGVIGLIIIVFALYILNLQSRKEHFLDPFKHLVNNKAFKYVLLMLLSYSLGILIDKFAVHLSNIYFYSLVNYFFVSIVLFVIVIFKARKSLVQLKTNLVPFSSIGLIVAAYTWLRLAALDLGKAGYVSAVQSSSVLFSIIFGILIFKEKDAFKKLLVGVLILFGLTIIKVFG